MNWSSRKRKLTPLQVQVVVYCAEKACHPMQAVDARVVSESSIDKWRVTEVQKWVLEYREAHPTAQETAERVKAQLAAMAAHSIKVVQDTLTSGAGNATAFKAAQYVLDGILADAATAPVSDARESAEVEELDRFLKLVQ